MCIRDRIYYIQPVAHVLTLTIYWQWLAMTDVVDEQRNQLLWELIWSVVVRADGHDGRHTVCIVESTDEIDVYKRQGWYHSLALSPLILLRAICESVSVIP